MKKILAGIVALALMMALAPVVFADDDNDGTIIGGGGMHPNGQRPPTIISPDDPVDPSDDPDQDRSGDLLKGIANENIDWGYVRRGNNTMVFDSKEARRADSTGDLVPIPLLNRYMGIAAYANDPSMNKEGIQITVAMSPFVLQVPSGAATTADIGKVSVANYSIAFVQRMFNTWIPPGYADDPKLAISNETARTPVESRLPNGDIVGFTLGTSGADSNPATANVNRMTNREIVLTVDSGVTGLAGADWSGIMTVPGGGVRLQGELQARIVWEQQPALGP
jgi:hypothetical protein